MLGGFRQTEENANGGVGGRVWAVITGMSGAMKLAHQRINREPDTGDPIIPVLLSFRAKLVAVVLNKSLRLFERQRALFDAENGLWSLYW